ncbi:Transducin/WD40 repeat-like superfamily protein [Abeliophyllum distichum]|uniref:Transducin/WD40 repeat-like superfamily protein n=1 Tax=Abeliophyllum distichum TaxID=126358 RepID=A0ABD1UEZ1_9LAMI
MSKAGEREEDEECFHDSLDRLLSSSNTSCSCSPSYSDSEEDPNPNFSFGASPDTNAVGPDPVPRFPIGVYHNYDVWISQPSSVEERRLRLLHQMGLTSDPSLLRHRPSLSPFAGTEFFNRSISTDHLINPGETFSYVDNNKNNSKNPSNSDIVNNIDCDNENSRVSGIVRSKSDGECNSSSEIHLINSTSTPSPVNDGTGGIGIAVHNDYQSHRQSCSDNVKNSRSDNSLPVTSVVSPNKPPKGKIRTDSTRNGSFSESLPILGNEELDEVVESTGTDDVNAECMIKNLDNGKEFVVNEVRKKIKEVDTGRQLTVEEFTEIVGTSPIVQELMRRQNVEDGNKDAQGIRRDGVVMRGIHHLRRVGGGRALPQMIARIFLFMVPERIRVRQYGKSVKDLTALYKSQEIQAHNGSIWTIKFSLDGKYLASAGEDCVIHVWQVSESERKGDLLLDKLEDGNLSLLFLANGSPEPSSMSPNLDSHSEKKRRGRSSISRKSVSFEQILVPETMFALLEKPICSFQGHLDDVLNLSWSKSQQLLSSSMDKTVRLWDLSSKSCLKIFSHSDYVTCIQFNPVDDRYFISGSLDGKVRIWSIPDRKVVDWNDLHEMVTAACYTPDGQGALVGSYKGSCRLYNTTENKLQQKSQINLDNKKKKSHHKKITGFQFAPGSSSEVLITSADSRIRVVDGVDLVHKFKGFHNTNSQISASISDNGRYVICASDDSSVYIWRHEGESRPNRNKCVTVTQSYEHFHCQDVSVAIPWPGISDTWGFQDTCSLGQNGHFDEISTDNHPPTPVEETNGNESSPLGSRCSGSPVNGTISSVTNSCLFDRIATWPEEKLLSACKNRSPCVSVDFSNGLIQNRSAWGMVIVTAGLRGEIRTFQNFGLPVRI